MKTSYSFTICDQLLLRCIRYNNTSHVWSLLFGLIRVMIMDSTCLKSQMYEVGRLRTFVHN